LHYQRIVVLAAIELMGGVADSVSIRVPAVVIRPVVAEVALDALVTSGIAYGL
jgi:hypothetical protein